MSRKIIKTPVGEGSSATYKIKFFDEKSTLENLIPVTPSSITWSLYDENHNIVNNEEDINVTPAEVIYITLEGLDFIVVDSKNLRFLVVKAIYSSDHQANLPLIQEFQITITDFVGMPT